MEKVNMGGQAAGILELLTDPLTEFLLEARLFADEKFAERGFTLAEELPLYDEGLLIARSRAVLGNYRRHEMPVIDEVDLEDLQVFLKQRFGDVVEFGTIEAADALPTQCQIYVDKAVAGTAKFGVEGTKQFLMSNHLVTAANQEILDGHHRWLTACTINPELALPQFRIDVPLEKLLPSLLEFSDARHERNA